MKMSILQKEVHACTFRIMQIGKLPHLEISGASTDKTAAQTHSATGNNAAPAAK